VPNLVQGRIVYPVDPVPDPQGKNPKANRPFVVISTRREIENGAELRLVGISRDVYGKDDEVELPWGPMCHTQLRQKSAAICSWIVSVRQDRIEASKGIVPPVQLRAILEKTRSASSSGKSE
jgi:hypothetical protein